MDFFYNYFPLASLYFFFSVFFFVFRLPINLTMAGGGLGVSVSKKYSLYEKSVVSEPVTFFFSFFLLIRTISNV